MICRLIFTLAVAMWAGPQPVPGADQPLHDLAIRALELETRALQWDTYWLNSRPPADYRPGDETEVEFFFPESRDAVGFCSPAFGWCSLLMAVDGELYNRGGWKFDEACGRECRIQRFQEEYLGAPRPLKTALSIGKADEPRFFDPNNLSLAREAAKTDKVSFDLSLTKSWVLLPLLETPASRSDGPPKNYAGLRKVVADYAHWGMHLTPEAPRSSIRALEDYSRTLGSFKSASPSGFKVNRCRPPAGRNERRL